jgi:hypothetical protein
MRKFKRPFIAALLVGLALSGSAGAGDRLYDESGKYKGQLQENGRIYNARGQYQGKVENGRLYDKKGSYKGQIRSSGIFNDSGKYTGTTLRLQQHYEIHRRYFPDNYED